MNPLQGTLRSRWLRDYTEQNGSSMPPASLGLGKATIDHWQTVLRMSLPSSEGILAMEQAHWKGLGMVAFVVTNQRVLVYPLSMKGGLGGTPGVSPHLKIERLKLQTVVEISPRKYSFNGIELTFNRAKQGAAAAGRGASLAGISVTPKSPDGPKPYRVEHVGLPTDTTEDKLVKYVGVPVTLLAAVAIVGTCLYLVVSWVGGLDDDEETGPSDADTYAYDAIYTPPEMGSSATGEAKFIDDVAGLGIQPVGSSSFEDLGSAICNDLQTSTNDQVVVEAAADAIGTTLEKAHYIVLSADYNLC